MTATQTPIKALLSSASKSHNLLISRSIRCLKFNRMLITLSVSLIGFAVVIASASPLFADYTLILKNGRTITVETYKEEGGRSKKTWKGSGKSLNRRLILPLSPRRWRSFISSKAIFGRPWRSIDNSMWLRHRGNSGRKSFNSDPVSNQEVVIRRKGRMMSVWRR